MANPSLTFMKYGWSQSCLLVRSTLRNKFSMKLWSKYIAFHSIKYIWKYHLPSVGHFLQASIFKMLVMLWRHWDMNFVTPGDMYSRIPLSRAPLTRGNQLVALAPWTPNFSDSSLAAAHMTEPVTHMCWSEQISPLVHSSQAIWQPFNLSHCIEMHNTHLLGRVG